MALKKLLKKKSQFSVDFVEAPPLVEQYTYSRPELLGSLSSHALQAFSCTSQRLVLCPTKPGSLPWAAGYAEVVNAGKSKTSEDQAMCRQGTLSKAGSKLDYTMFALYDGHGGNGMSTTLVHQLHLVIHNKLELVLPQLLEAWSLAREADPRGERSACSLASCGDPESQLYQPSLVELVTGCLEEAFWQMDSSALAARREWTITGGSTALVALFVCDRIFVANAGDSRAVVFRSKEEYRPEPVSFDFTPESDRQRIQSVAALRPELLQDPRTGETVFSRIQLARPCREEDIGSTVLYRDFYMSGWALKEVTPEDVRLLPLILGRDKAVRLMMTMGVARALGDWDLVHRPSKAAIKDFLTPQPEVQVYKAYGQELGQQDYLVMATDGLWDVLTNEEAGRHLLCGREEGGGALQLQPTKLARGLVELARGEKRDGYWEKLDENLASGDDISVFVIPLGNSSST